MKENALMAGVRRALHLLSLLAVLLGTGVDLMAGSRLIFPALAAVARISITNPGSEETWVEIALYDPEGIPLSGRENPLHLALPPHQQVSLGSEDLLGEGDVEAWAEATGPADGLVGHISYRMTGLARLDATPLRETSRELLFGQIRVGGDQATALRLINPGETPAQVVLEVFQTEKAPSRVILEIPPMGMAGGEIGQLFGLSAASPGAYLVASSDVELAGLAVVGETPSDWVVWHGADATRKQRLSCGGWFHSPCHFFIPQMILLGGWKSELGLLNRSPRPATLRIRAFASDGTLYDGDYASQNPVERHLEPGEGFQEDVAALFGFSGEGTLDGYLELESTSAAIHGYLNFGIPSSGAWASVSATARPRTRALVSRLQTGESGFTGLALLNPGAMASNVRLLALTPEGEILGSFDTALTPGQRIGKLIRELVPASAGQPSGMVWVKSDLPLYLNAVRGDASAMASLPLQTVPPDYLPDRSLSPLELKPRLSVVQPRGEQQFYLEGEAAAPLWRVNGIEGGDETVGTIDPQGRYRAPRDIPTPQIVTVTAQQEERVVGVSVDILDRETLFTGLRRVKSLAYIDSLATLFTAELSLLGSSGSLAVRPGAAVPGDPRTVVGEKFLSSTIYSSPEGSERFPLASYPNEQVSKIVPFRTPGGRDFLLLTGHSTGRIIRLDPGSGESVDLVTGLASPTSLVVDPVHGDLLVAEGHRISQVPSSLLQPEVSSEHVPAPGDGLETLLETVQTGGLAVDTCTGRIYVSDRAGGQILEYSRRTGQKRVLTAGLNLPGQILAIHRKGVGCPGSLQLLVSDGDGDRILVSVPAQRLLRPWIQVRGNTDLIFLPRGNPFRSSSEAVLLTETPGFEPEQPVEAGASDLVVVEVPDLYTEHPTSQPGGDEDLATLPEGEEPSGADAGLPQQAEPAKGKPEDPAADRGKGHGSDPKDEGKREDEKDAGEDRADEGDDGEDTDSQSQGMAHGKKGPVDPEQGAGSGRDDGDSREGEQDDEDAPDGKGDPGGNRKDRDGAHDQGEDQGKAREKERKEKKDRDD